MPTTGMPRIISRPRLLPGSLLRLLSAPLEDRDEIEADEVDDALLVGAHPLALELIAENARRGDLGRRPQFLRPNRGTGPAGEQIPGLHGGPTRRAPERSTALLGIERFHAPRLRQVSMKAVNCCENSM